MSKAYQSVECIVLQIGDKKLNDKIKDDKVVKCFESFIYFPFSEIDEEDLEGVKFYCFTFNF